MTPSHTPDTPHKMADKPRDGREHDAESKEIVDLHRVRIARLTVRK